MATPAPTPPSAGKRPYPPSDPAEMRKYLSMGETAYLAEKHALSLADFHRHRQYRFPIAKTLHRALYYWTGYWSFSAKELRDQTIEPAIVLLSVAGALPWKRLAAESSVESPPA
jgi:hypothetical protein